MDTEECISFQGRLCVSDSEELKKEVLGEAHWSRYTIHPGGTKMYHDLKRTFWWEGMKRDVVEYVSRCMVCQQVKAEHQRSSSLLKALEIPVWEWECISMDFVDGLSRSKKENKSIWVIVDRLTKSAYFIPVSVHRTVDKLAQFYIREIVHLHRTSVSSVLDWDSLFVAEFWESFQRATGTQLDVSTAYHPQSDWQTERVN